jgi:LysM repeat protein
MHMPIINRRPLLAVLLALLALSAVSGCGKYDHLERNMQYVSDDLLRRDAVTAWEQLTETHARWASAGHSRDKDNPAFAAYEDAYARYAIIYNELIERQGSRSGIGGRLGAASDALPPPPPGAAVAAKPKTTPAPAAAEPTIRNLSDVPPSSPAPGIPMDPSLSPAIPAKTPAVPSAPKPAATTTSSSGDRYIVKTGDTLRLIAKRHGISEKSLMDANGLTDPDKIAAGKTLVIPAR